MSGYGIGGFMDGLADGLQTGQAIAARQSSLELDQRRMQLLEEEAKRKVETDAFDRDYKSKNMQLLQDHSSREAAAEKRIADEYGLNAPLRESTRNAGLMTQQGLIRDQETNRDVSDIRTNALKQHDAAREKSILQETDEGGKPIYSSEGQKYGSREEAQSAFEKNHPFWKEFNSNPNGLNKLVNTLEAAGKYTEADAARKFYSDKNAANGLQQQGLLVEAMGNFNIEGVKKHFNEMLKDPNYLIQDGYDIKVDFAKDDKGNVIKGEDGKPLGIDYNITNKRTGEVFADKAIGQDDVITKLGWAAHPENIIQWNAAQRERILKEKAEAAKKGIEVGGKILEKESEMDGRLRQQIDKEMNAADNRAAGTMTPEQKQAEFTRRYNLARKPIKPSSPTAGGGVPTMTWGPGR